MNIDSPGFIRIGSRIFLLCVLAMVPAAAGTGRVVYQSPVANSARVTPGTTIIFRMSGAVDRSQLPGPTGFDVRGSASGSHQVDVVLSDDERTMVLIPHPAFEPGEDVHVTALRSIPLLSGEAVDPPPIDFSTGGTPPRIAPAEQQMQSVLGNDGLIPYAGSALENRSAGTPRTPADSLPLDFPAMHITTGDSIAPGVLFLGSVGFLPGQISYLMILQNNGVPLYTKRMRGYGFDFKVQPNGSLTYFDAAAGCYYQMDSSFQIVDTFRCGNGYPTDLHELRLLDNGHALLMSYDYQPVDMSAIVTGGNPSATVIGLVVQELDRAKNVVFQWRSWDHYSILDATHEDLTAKVIDYVHGNAIELDADSNLIISCRHMDEITKINRETGDIIWRMGGKNNQFTFPNDTVRFSHQHAIRRLPGGSFTMFDNGNFHGTPFSRAVEYRLDENAKTATRLWEYRHNPSIFGFAMGYVQRLPNGNTLIGWGAANPSVTEVRPDGSVAFELSFEGSIYSYRAFRYPWPGTDTTRSLVKPTAFRLYQNYPNPFNGHTTIVMDFPVESTVDVTIYDILGRPVQKVVQGFHRTPGEYYVNVDLSALSTGVYFYRVSNGTDNLVRRMVMIR